MNTLFILPILTSEEKDLLTFILLEISKKSKEKIEVCENTILLCAGIEGTLSKYQKIFLFSKKDFSSIKKVNKLHIKSGIVDIFKTKEFKLVAKTNNNKIYLMPSFNKFVESSDKTKRFINFFGEKELVVDPGSYKEMQFNQPICIDIETEGLDFTKDKILCFGYGTKENVNSLIWDNTTKLLAKDVLKQSSNIVGHNLVFDLSFLIHNGCSLPKKVFDTLVLSKIYKTNLSSYNLEDLCFNLLNIEYHAEDIDKSKCSSNPQRTIAFNRFDVIKTINLAKFLGEKVVKNNYSILPILNTYMDAVRMFSLIKTIPVVFNAEKKEKEKSFIEYHIQELEEKIKKITGIENIRSSKQLREYLFDEVKFNPLRNTKGGEFSTDMTTLQELNSIYGQDILSLIIEYKKRTSLLDKFYSKYGSKVYSTYNVHGTETGRTSCSSLNKENLQQLPPDMLFRWLKEARSKFDFSQLELRIGAHVAEEKVLLGLFTADKDVHDYTQEKIRHFLDKAKVPEQIYRRIAKTLNFGVFYGGTGYTLYYRLLKDGVNIPMSVCDKLAVIIQKAFPNIEKYRKEVYSELLEKGHVDILTGRKTNYTLLGANCGKQKAILREAANAKIQGLASDICLNATVSLWKNHGLLPLIYRHDEAIYRESFEELIQYKEKIEKPEILLACAINLNSPLKVDFTNLTK